MTVTFFVQTLAKVTQEVVQLPGVGRASNAGGPRNARRMSEAWAQIAMSTRRAAAWLWRLLTSVKLALSLILAIAVVGLMGIVLDQVPGHLAGQAGGKDRWLETVAKPEYGMWTDVLDSLGLFQVFRSPWFLVPVAVLACCQSARMRHFETEHMGMVMRGVSAP